MAAFRRTYTGRYTLALLWAYVLLWGSGCGLKNSAGMERTIREFSFPRVTLGYGWQWPSRKCAHSRGPGYDFGFGSAQRDPKCLIKTHVNNQLILLERTCFRNGPHVLLPHIAAGFKGLTDIVYDGLSDGESRGTAHRKRLLSQGLKDFQLSGSIMGRYARIHGISELPPAYRNWSTERM